MAFTNTSDSIVIKAVLTEKGRKLLSRGQFKIAKFAFGDDEIDYSLVEHKFINSEVLLDEFDGPTASYAPYRSIAENSKLLEAYSDKRKNIIL